MAIDTNPSLLVTAGIVLLVLWRVYARMRRMIGRQKLSRRRPWITVVIFPLLLLLLVVASLPRPPSLAALAIGVVIGGALGTWGLRLTRFEATPEGIFYTPNAHLGIALSLLLIGRIAFRFVQLRLLGLPFTSPPADFARSPLTLAIFGTLAGYYIVYAIGLLRWERGDRAPADAR